MAASGGHWESLAEAQKLTQSMQIAGIIEEDIKLGGLTMLLPVAQSTGLDLKYNRETTGQQASRARVGTQLHWTDAVQYTLITRSLKIHYIQTPLNNFISGVYGTFNDYRAIQLMEDKKAIVRLIDDGLVYGNPSLGADGDQEVGGLHYLATLYPTNFDGDSLNIDEGEAGLSLANIRSMEDSMKAGIDFWYFPLPIARRLDAYLQEAGIGTPLVQIQMGAENIGFRVGHLNGIPVVRTHYLTAEQANVGLDTTDLRAKHSSGDKQYSVFAIKRGQVMLKEPGLSYIWGGEQMADGEMLRIQHFPTLEDFDAEGLRITNYSNLADGSTVALARITDIEDVAVVS